MYPFYYPFASPFCYNQFPSYHYDLNNPNQFFSLAQQFILQDKQEKVQEVNTSYSVNGPALQHKQVSKTSTNSHLKQDFQLSKDSILKTQKIKQKRDGLQYKLKVKPCSNDNTQRLRYVNKNFESNVINKIFAFLWSEDKSKPYVEKILKDKTKTKLYFEYIKIVRKYCKRYINKEYLLDLCDYQPQHIAYRIVAKNIEKLKYFSMYDLSQTIRKLIFIYLKDVCTLSILTSKKMRTDIWKDHFEKSRNIYQYLFQGLSSEEYDLRMSQSYESIYAAAKGPQQE